MLSLNFFHKELLKICNANCSRVVSSFTVPSRHFGASTVLNQMRFVRTSQYLKSYLHDSSKNFSFAFVKKNKRFSPQLFVECFNKKNKNLGDKQI